MDTPLTADPGWYADPTGAGQLRRWDGERWTEEVRPLPATRSARRHPHATLVTGVAAAAVIVIALVVYGVASSGGSSPRRSHSAVGCGLAATRPTLDAVVTWLRGHGLNIRSQPAPVPIGACEAMTFTDGGSTTQDAIVSFPSYQVAQQSADRGTRDGGTGFAAGVYVIGFGAAQESRDPAYLTLMHQFVTQVSDPNVPVSTLFASG